MLGEHLNQRFLRHMCGWFLACSAVLPLPAGASDLDARVMALCAEAKRARAESRLEVVERKRRERWELIEAAAEDPAHVQSPWVAAYKAISEVDGKASVDVDDLKDIGLVNRMDYKAAAERLRKALVQARAVDGPYLGELATRLFEVAQQARACYRDAMKDGSPNLVATVEELMAALQDAEARDPCCVVATPMRLFLSRPDPQEAFLRAELRPSLKVRQKQLVDLSHRLTFLGEGSDPKAEHTADAVLPWHALTELDKAASLGFLLEELDYATYLTPEEVGPDYVLPGKVIVGRDSLSDPFTLLYGRYLICRLADKKGRLRTAELFPNEKGEWEHRYLELLCRVPAADDTSEPSELAKFVSGLPARAEFTLLGEKYVLRDFPVESCELLLTNQVKQLCVRNADALTKLRANPTGNNPKAVLSLLSTQQRQVRTSPIIDAALQKFAAAGDRTKYPLVELLREFDPLVIVSDDDGVDAQPQFLMEQGGKPYLRLDDGHRLFFDLDAASSRAPCAYVEYPGATAFMPLHLHSIPLNLLAAGKMGQAFAALLRDAGYSEDQVDQELQKCVEKPDHIPPRFKVRLEARAKSTKKSVYEVMAGMLAEQNWNPSSMFFPEEVWRLYGKYGFRYLRDKRSNWIVNSRFGMDQGVDSKVGGVNTEADLREYPFDFRAQDGKQRVDRRQVYSWTDYKGLKSNVYVEHLAKAMLMHPCLPIMELVAQDASTPLENPAELKANYDDENKFIESIKRRLDAYQAAANRRVDKVVLESPVAAWLASDDPDQVTTLSNLHNAFLKQIHSAGAITQLMEGYVLLYQLLDQIEGAIGGLPKWRDALKNLRERLDKDFNAAVASSTEKTRPVLAIQLETARYFAEKRYLHLAMVHYNDLLVQQRTARYSTEGEKVFEEVADTQRAEKFATSFQSLVDGQRLAVVCQLELAGVLNAAGISESAHALWQRVVDEYDLFVAPSIRIAEETLTSYGIRFSDRATEAFGSYEALAKCARDALAKHRLMTDWRTLDLPRGPAQNAMEQVVDAIERQMERERAGEKFTADEKRAFDQSLAGVRTGRELDFRTWLRFRKALVPRGNVAYRPLSSTGYALHPQQFCPAVYSQEDGFVRPLAEVLERANAADIEGWCAGAAKDDAEGSLAIDACFLVGWYWLDAGRPAKARAAFMQLAAELRQRSAAAQDKVAKSTLKLNELSAVLGSASVVEDVPGVSGFKSDFSAFLKPQILWWERQWFAASLYGPHASVEGRRIERQATVVQSASLASIAAWRSQRYFLRDYTYFFGAVSDWLAMKALLTPELFNAELKKEEISGRKGGAVEGRRWALLTQKHADGFFGELKVDADVRQDIVDLAP
jgi:hypothetical protein